MDSHNLFMTPTTYRVVRLEYAGALAAAVVLLLLHLGQVNWFAFAALFAYIDLIGYLPGAIAWRRAHGRLDTRTYHVLYNVMHNFVTAGAVAAIWSLTRGPEWALLALPIHLCGDRALFGNILKPFGLSFEPQVHPAYQELVKRYDADLRAGSEPDIGSQPAARAA
jgi:hypothetical protein